MKDLETIELTEKRANAKELNAEFTMEEVRGVIEGMKKQKAADFMGLILRSYCRQGWNYAAVQSDVMKEWGVPK
jgi:hypothetical protein